MSVNHIKIAGDIIQDLINGWPNDEKVVPPECLDEVLKIFEKGIEMVKELRQNCDLLHNSNIEGPQVAIVGKETKQ